MGLRINPSNPGLGIQRQVNEASNNLIQGLTRLASQQRINRAADDASGLAISERFRSQLRQFAQETRNLQDGISAAQTAEGGLSAQQDGLQRLRDLATQAANGTLSDEQRQALNTEAQQILEGINETASQTEFNGQNLLNANTSLDLGTEGDLALNVNESTAGSLGVAGVDLSTQGGASTALDQIDQAINQVSQNRASLGAQQNRFTRAIEQREINSVNAQDAESRIRDLDLARQTIEQTRNELLLNSGISGLLQSNLLAGNAARLLGG